MARYHDRNADAMDGETILMQGSLLKRGSRLSSAWNERYFVLRGSSLAYYVKRADVQPKGRYQITPDCKITEVYTLEFKDKKARNDPTPAPHDLLMPDIVRNQMELQASVQNSISNFTSVHKRKKSFNFMRHSDKNSENSKQLSNSREEEKVKDRGHNQLGFETRYCIKITWPDHQAPSVAASKIEQDVPLLEAAPLPQHSPPHSPKPNHQHESDRSQPQSDSPSTIAHGQNQIRWTKSEESGDSPQLQMTAINKNDKMRHTYTLHKKSKYKKKIIQGTGLAAASVAAVTATVITSGFGLLGVMVFVGATAAAGGSGAVAGRSIFKQVKKSSRDLVLAVQSLEEAMEWRVALMAVVRGEVTVESDTWANLFQMEREEVSRKVASCLLPSKTEGQSVLLDGIDCNLMGGGDGYCIPTTRWRPLEGGWAMFMGSGAQGLRIFQEENGYKPASRLRGKLSSSLSVEGRPCSALKAQLILPTTPLNAFMCLMSHSRLPASATLAPASDLRSSFRVIETIDDHMDVIHLLFRPLYLFPSWTSPRDFCLFRYWRFDDDGSYIICYETVQHRECPPMPGYIRGALHGVFSIAPKKLKRKKHTGKKENNNATLNAPAQNECLLTHIVQVDPKGWVPTVTMPFLSNQGYAEAFAVSALLQMLDVRDALDHERFVNVSLDVKPPVNNAIKISSSLRGNITNDYGGDTGLTPGGSLSEDDADHLHDVHDAFNYDFSYSSKEMTSLPNLTIAKHTISNLLDSLNPTMWAQPDANSFRVRGKTYLKDKKKNNAGESVFRLITVDMVEVQAPILTGMCGHPTERVQLAMSRRRNNLEIEIPPFIVAVNIAFPGPPFYHLVLYYAVDDISLIDGTQLDNPFSTLANKFFFGESDDFRDKTFKLIPQIVQGNFLVRKAVGSTPAIMGNKLKQTYHRGEGYFEILLDVGSDAIAAGVVRLSTGYAKTLVTDMAFLLEGCDESTLPEKVMGCARIKHVDFGAKMRFCQGADDVEII